MSTFQSTRPVRGATGRYLAADHATEISIHAPHAGRDRASFVMQTPPYRFQSTRPMRGATTSAPPITSPHTFQSTRPMRGATGVRRPLNRGGRDFNPRAPCGARLTHSNGPQTLLLFQSTRPMRGATGSVGAGRQTLVISIHAPHAGRDSPTSQHFSRKLNFNPRAPCGARPPPNCSPVMGSVFQSTRPMRGATSVWLRAPMM